MGFLYVIITHAHTTEKWIEVEIADIFITTTVFILAHNGEKCVLHG